MKKIVVNNYQLNSNYLNLNYFYQHKKELFFVINEILNETNKLNDYNILFDLNEWFISENNYFVSLIDYINSCKFVNNKLYFDKLRLEILSNQLVKIKKEIAKIIEKKEMSENGN